MMALRQANVVVERLLQLLNAASGLTFGCKG